MRDVEELLRDTLTDPRRRVEPAGGMYETVNRRAHTIRRNRWALASAATAVVAVIASATTIAANSPSHRAQPGNQTSSTAVGPTPGLPSGRVGTGVNVGDGFPTSAAMAADGVFVVTNNPAQLVKLDASGSRILATAPLGAPQANGVTVGDGRVWVWNQTPGELYLFNSKTLQPLGVYTVGTDLFGAAEVDGFLYVTSAHGLLRASATKPADQAASASSDTLLAASKVPDVEGGTYAVTADPARHRVLVGVMPLSPTPTNTYAGVRVVALDARTGKVVATSPQTSVGKESIAVIGDQVWVGGYGDTDKPLIEHLDAATLKVVGTSPVGAFVAPGAILWAGAKVLWVRNGADETLSCVDPKTGAILEQWPAIEGPVISATGHAFGIHAGLQPLDLTGGCTG